MYKVEIHKPTNNPICSVYSPSPLFGTHPLISPVNKPLVRNSGLERLQHVRTVSITEPSTLNTFQPVRLNILTMYTQRCNRITSGLPRGRTTTTLG